MSSANVATIPPFTEKGVLPVGKHACLRHEVERRLVVPFPGSTRRFIYEEWRSHRAALRSLAPVLWQWVDGSFVTAATNPGDIDVVTFVDGLAFDQLPRWKRDVVAELCNGRGGMTYSRVDASFVAVFPRGDRRREQYERQRSYWRQKWSRTRDGIAKGFLEVRC